jgi:hypothetical protein
MANQEQLDIILKQGVQAWNQWRREHPEIQPDLRDANLIGTNLGTSEHRGRLERELIESTEEGKFSYDAVNFSNADLSNANLREANLRGADLSNANLRGAYLNQANLNLANLDGADLGGANLSWTSFNDASLTNADLGGARVGWTNFGFLSLKMVKGLETVRHIGPSIIGTRMLEWSQGDIPEAFLRGAGLSDTFITYIHSLVGKPIEYYSCFISYSSKDEALARRLYADLQSNHVRCWFAPEDMKIGDEIRVRIDESIRVYDKLLIVLSEHSVESTWVEDEVEAALEKERVARKRGERRTVLFPIQLDESMKNVASGWPAKIRRTRHIGDFRNWKNHDEYQIAFARLLRDLQAQ